MYTQKNTNYNAIRMKIQGRKQNAYATDNS